MSPDSGSQARAAPPAAGLARRLSSAVYEMLLLTAVMLAAAIPFVAATQSLEPGLARRLIRGYLLLIAACYFIWQWLRGGQTLAMKTWRIRLVTRDGSPLTPGRGICRFLYALTGIALFGAGYAWALVDREGQFLHDRLAGTKIVMSDE